MRPWCQALLCALLLLWGHGARAAITCTSITSPGVSINYVNNTVASAQTQFTVSCTRSSTSDPQSIAYSVKADNGGNPQGINNRAGLGAATLRYDLYTTSGCSTQWKGNTAISDTITWAPGATGTVTRQTSFWGCIVTAQAATSAGAYTDSVGLTLSYGNNNPAVGGTVPVAIYAPAYCSVVTAPSNLSLTYAAFGPQVAQGSNFVVSCTSGMPYTLATDVTEAVLSGVRYVLSLDVNASNGTGAPRTHRITATIPAGQAGACAVGSCNASRTHALTITY